MFTEWKSFIDFIYANKFEEIFECKFISPHDFEKIYANNKFPKENWEKVLKAILSTGIKPEHNLFFRIPKFIEYESTISDKSNRGASGGDKSTGAVSKARIQALRDY